MALLFKKPLMRGKGRVFFGGPNGNNGVIMAIATPSVATPNNPDRSQEIVQLVSVALTNLADPYKGHQNRDTPIQLRSDTDTGPAPVSNIAWIAAEDAAVNHLNNPRMPQLQAKIAAPAGSQVLWKLQVTFHDRFGNPHRDFDTGAVQDTPVPADTVTIPAATAPNKGWHTITDGTPWNIYQDPDWTAAVSQGFFGGDAVLSVKVMSSDGQTTLVPQIDLNFRIAGENPDPVKCKAFIQNTDTAKWWIYAIAKHETKGDGGRPYYNQFLDNGAQVGRSAVKGKEGKPDWNNDGTPSDPVSGSGGYGLLQLTYQDDPSEPNFIMPRDWIWNWQSNVKQGIIDYKPKLIQATNYVNAQRALATVNHQLVPVPKHSTSRESNPDSGEDDNPHVPPAGQPMTMIGGDDVYGFPAGAKVSFYDSTLKPTGQGELIEVAQSIKAYNGLNGGNYVSWNGTAWQFNRSRTNQAKPNRPPKDNKSYVDLISIEIEAADSHAVSP